MSSTLYVGLLCALGGCAGDAIAPVPAPLPKEPEPPPTASIASAPAPPDAAHALVLTPEQCTTQTRPRAARSDALADLDVLAHLFDRAWAGLELRKATADPAALFTTLRSAIEAMPDPVDTASLEDALAEGLRPLLDSHVAFFLYGQSGWSRYRPLSRTDVAYAADLALDLKGTVIAGDAPKGFALRSCEGADLVSLLKASTTDELVPVRRAIVVSSKPPPPLVCTFARKGKPDETRRLAMHRLHVDGPPEPLDEPLAIEAGDVLTLRARSFAEAHAKALEAFAGAAPQLRQAKGAVLDLRGNTGGSDRPGLELFRSLVAGELRRATTSRLTSEATFQGALNRALCDRAYASSDQPDLGELDARLRNAITALERASGRGVFREWAPKEVATAPGAASSLTQPLVVLADKLCASACEELLLFARQLPLSLHVGESSRGVGELGEPVIFRLPRTGLGVAISTARYEDPSGERGAEEGAGRAPDLWLDTKEAPKVARGIAACLAKPKCPLRAAIPRLTARP